MSKNKKINIDSVDFLLKLAQHTREVGVSWSGGYPLDRKVLEFAQRYKVVTFREIRGIIKHQTLARKSGEELTSEVEKLLNINSNCNWITSTLSEPEFYPTVYRNNKEVSFKHEMKELINNNKRIKEKYDIYSSSHHIIMIKSKNVIEWIKSLYHEGKLEKHILTHKTLLSQKSKRTYIGKALLGNLIEPEKTETILEKGETPSLTVREREAFQFLLWKAENLNEEERIIKNDFILEGKEEDVKKNGLIVIFEGQEALRKGYGEDMSLSGFHYEKLGESMQSLLEKKRKLLISKKKGNLELSISLIDKLEMTFTAAGKAAGKKYIMARIPYDVFNHHGRYTAFPENHFALLRKTPPKTTPDKTETRFFDILYNEKPYKKNQDRIVRRLKNNFLLTIGGKGLIEQRNKERLADRIENLYVPKAVNLGLIKSFKEDTNREDEIVYVIEYEAHEEMEKHLNGQKN